MSDIRLDFALSADPRRDATLRPGVERAVTALLDDVGASRIEAVVLAGSLARGEASVLFESATWRLLGDMEFLIIMRDVGDWGRLRRQMTALSDRITSEVGGAAEIATVEYTPAGLSYLRRAIRPCIFAYDLVHTGKVVWGRTDVLSEVAAFGAGDIPREDAVRLLMNRVVELMLLDDGPAKGAASEWRRAYQLVKVMLDLAGSVLAFAGRHASRYGDRAAAFAEMLDTFADLRSALPRPGDFVETLRWATRCKLEPSEALLAARPPTARKSLVSEWAQALWVWESRRLLGRPLATFSDLVDAYVRQEPLATRLRGWAKLWLHPLRPPRTLSIAQTARWMLRSSPQRLTYGAALIAVWGSGAAKNNGRHQAAGSLLPIRRRADAPSVTPSEIGDVWRWLVRTN